MTSHDKICAWLDDMRVLVPEEHHAHFEQCKEQVRKLGTGGIDFADTGALYTELASRFEATVFLGEHRNPNTDEACPLPSVAKMWTGTVPHAIGLVELARVHFIATTDPGNSRASIPPEQPQ